MTAEDAFVALVGERLVHRTLAENARAIHALGLLTPQTLAQRAGVDPRVMILRRDRILLQIGPHSARLNHQLPLRAGRTQELTFLDGHSLESWAEQLDQRVYFWPTRGGSAFGDSLADVGPMVEFGFDSRALFRRHAERIDLSPINSGNARRRATRRGDWLYVPATQADSFGVARLRRGEAHRRDRVAEVSLRGDLSPEDLASCLTAARPVTPGR